MGATLWGPVPGGYASVWFPGGAASCQLPDRPPIDFLTAPTFATYVGDNFTDTNGVGLSTHISDAAGPWNLVTAPEFVILDGSLSIPHSSIDDSLMNLGIEGLEGVGNYLDFQAHFADYGKGELAGFISMYVIDASGLGFLASLTFTVSRLSANDPLTVVPGYSMQSYGTGDLGEIELPLCSWNFFRARLDWTDPPNPVLIMTVNDFTQTIPLVGEGWNNTNVANYMASVQAHNTEPNAFRIADVGIFEPPAV